MTTPLSYEPQHPPRRHARSGIASFVIALLLLVTLFLSLIIRPPHSEVPLFSDTVYLIIIISFGTTLLLGVLLGARGYFQKNVKRSFAVIGLIVNLLIMFGIIAAICLIGGN